MTGSFGLLAGLGGVALQARLQDRQKAADREYQKKNLLRTKAEEVFLEAEIVEEKISAAHMQAIEDAHGVARSTPLLDLVPTGKVKALLRVYFPASESIITEHTALLHKTFEKQQQANEAVGNPALEEKLQRHREARVTAAKESGIIIKVRFPPKADIRGLCYRPNAGSSRDRLLWLNDNSLSESKTARNIADKPRLGRS